MKYKIRTTNQFDKALVRCKKRNYPIDKLQMTINLLAETCVLPKEYNQHKLKSIKGNNTWGCHILPDWLLVWEQHENMKTNCISSCSTQAHIPIYFESIN